MDAKELRALLGELTEAGVWRAKVPVLVGAAGAGVLEVEFSPRAAAGGAKTPTTSTFVDAEGKPIDLSEGAGELADDGVDANIAAANFKPQGG